MAQRSSCDKQLAQSVTQHESCLGRKEPLVAPYSLREAQREQGGGGKS
jgi:hypothetical protein